MQKRNPKRALIALFLALLMAPTLIGLATGDRFKSENLENRTLAKLPKVSLDAVAELPAAFEAWYADNQPFRDQLIFVRALMSRALYDRDVSDKVIFGKDNWLFYCCKSDGAPVDSYRGEDLFTGVELRQIASNLVRTRDDLRKQGCEFVLFIAPNKERVYSEYMPDRFGAPADNYGVKQLVRFLRQRTDLNVVYCCDEIMQARQDFPDLPLYFSNDTHWNEIGSYIGTRALMRALGVTLPALTRDMISPSERTGPDDLARLSHLKHLFPNNPCWDVTGGVPAEDFPKRRLYFRLDSFGAYMQPFLEPLLPEEDGITYAGERDDASVDRAHPDVFVMEVLERFVRRQLEAGPLYAAPENRDAEAQPDAKLADTIE